MNYAPAGKSEVTSLEFVEFNSSVTLSQQYTILGKVAKEVGKVYEKSGDETLASLAQGYYLMEGEAKYLSKLVEKQLQEYDMEILQSSAVLIDPWWTCIPCIAACLVGVVAACAACCATTGVCCVCWDWLLMFPVDVVCAFMCETLGACP